MDTGSESFKSQDTPNSILSDFEDTSIENVLRLQNPDVLRLAEPENDNINQLSDSFVYKMSNMNIKSTPDSNKSSLDIKSSPDNNKMSSDLKSTPDNKISNMDMKSTQDNTKTSNLNVKSTTDNTMSNSNIKSAQDKTISSNIDTKTTDNKTTIDNRPKQLNIQKSSNLVLATNHPLMVLNSPDYPDVIPKLIEEKDLSLSSVEDEKFYDLYRPETNTSKNNLYCSEHFVTAESVDLNHVDNTPPDVARIEQKERRKIIAR